MGKKKKRVNAETQAVNEMNICFLHKGNFFVSFSNLHSCLNNSSESLSGFILFFITTLLIPKRYLAFEKDLILMKIAR